MTEECRATVSRVEPEGLGQVAQHCRGRIDTGQIQPPHAVAITRRHTLGQRQRQAALADASASGEGHQALPRQASDQRPHQFVATDQRAEPGRQVVPRCRVPSGLLQRRNQAIAALGFIENVATTVECTAQGGDMHPQVVLFHHAARPDAGDQGVFADKLPRRFEQHRQDIQRAPAQRHRHARLADQALLAVKGVGAKAHRMVVVHLRKSAETPELGRLRILLPWACRYLASSL